MTSKEALEFIIDMFNKYAQKPNDIGLFFKFCEAHNKVLQALERNEELEKENKELTEMLQLSNEYNAGFERVKADLMIVNKELKERLKKYE